MSTVKDLNITLDESAFRSFRTPLFHNIPFFFVEGFYNFIHCFNIRSLYMSGSPTTAARELARYKSDLVGVQEVR